MIKAAIAVCLLALSGCASMTPTTEEKASYAIYDIRATDGLTASRIAEAVKDGLQKQTSQVQISQGIPPSPLPEKPGRFKLVNPFGPNLAAIAGQSLQMPTCDPGGRPKCTSHGQVKMFHQLFHGFETTAISEGLNQPSFPTKCPSPNRNCAQACRVRRLR
jgi:hypothetical protein